ncbi:MAG: cysteine desulfurase family protein [Sphingomicrobium sp.]
MIYLDYQATTPLAPEVAAAMQPWVADRFANPHSPSRWGREADAAIDHARREVEDAIGFGGGSLAFTGSATEAINWALKGSVEQSPPGRNRIITLASEHAAVLDSCAWLSGRGVEITVLAVGKDGLLDLAVLQQALGDDVLLVCAMMVNNEIGVIQRIGEIAELAHTAGAIMLCDAVQGFGRIDLPEGPDLVAISAHKIHGPKAIGALWMRDGAEPAPFIHGGGQERGMRSGTLSPALCVGFGAAASLARERTTRDFDHAQNLWHLARTALGPGWDINGSTDCRYPGNLNIRRDRIDGARLLADLRGIAFSLGSACASGSGRPSHVLKAIGLDYPQARSSLRLGFGRYTEGEDLVAACKQIDQAADRQGNVPG